MVFDNGGSCHGANDFELDLERGQFGHVWYSRIHELKKGELLDLNEFRSELRPDGDGTLFTFVVYSMNGDEWRSFTRVTEAPMYYEQFGGIDPWAASSWHHSLDQLESAITNKVFPRGGLLDRMKAGEQPGGAHYHFYLNYLRHLHKLRTLSKKTPLQPIGVDSSQFGLPRTEEAGPPPPKPDPNRGPDVAHATIEKVVLEAQTVLVIEGETDLGAYLGNAFERILAVIAYADREGIARTGPSFIRNVEIRSDGTIGFFAGIHVAEGTVGNGNIKQMALPAGSALMLAFSGDYSQARTGWQKLVAHADAQRIPLVKPGASDGGWHALMNDVREVGMNNAISRLYLPVAE